MDNKKLFMIELGQRENKASMHPWSNNQGTNIVEHPHECTSNLYKALEEDHEMPEHSDKLPYDLYEMPSCETTKTVNFEIHGEIQPELVTEDHGDELNTVETNSDPIDIVIDLTIKVDVKDKLTSNMELKLIVNESVEELIHFLVIVEKVLAEEINEFDLFSSEKGNKAQVLSIRLEQMNPDANTTTRIQSSQESFLVCVLIILQ
ncbi:hypothetical protein PVK06_024626 [Gossypium arboreum]|uniref:Uncharacterized protein n=1 Tax=Gossypium arboreum TaxID=29729 RepID=A0ABR0PEN0_GOSAR|nr:hypothetical protein PVK06_024626 [Gossypium arboreum]